MHTVHLNLQSLAATFTGKEIFGNVSRQTCGEIPLVSEMRNLILRESTA